MSNDLEQAFRDGLRSAADRVDTAVPLAERARAGARTRRRRRWAVVGTVAATLVAATGVSWAVSGGGDPDQKHAADQPTTTVTEWRAESWHGLTVDVPADWGWGTAPVGGGTGLCGGPGPMVSADGHKSVNPKRDLPWVGRPVMLSDVCITSLDSPAAPYVWLGAHLEPGTVELGDGYTQETVEAYGTTVTVATRDPVLSRQILRSARSTTDCATTLSPAEHGVSIPTEGLNPVHSAQVCVYDKERGDTFDLTYADGLDETTAQELYDHGLADTGPRDCDSPADQYALVTFSGGDAMGTAELTLEWLVDPACETVTLGGAALPLSDRGMALWSQNGTQAVLRAFIGMLG